MSALNSCLPDCSPVNIPGPQGETGATGTSGTNAFASLAATLTIPAVGANVTAAVDNSTWMAIGQNLFISDGTHKANFKVSSVPTSSTVTLTCLGYVGDSGAGTVIALNGIVSPSGAQLVLPLSAADKATWQAGYGLGQDPLSITGTGLAQTITNAAVRVGAVTFNVASKGSYLVFGSAIIRMAGVTFAASRVITLQVRNVTQNVVIATSVFQTEILTTTNIPDMRISVPVLVYAAANIADVINLEILIDTVPSAGTLTVESGNLLMLPIRLQ